MPLILLQAGVDYLPAIHILQLDDGRVQRTVQWVVRLHVQPAGDLRRELMAVCRGAQRGAAVPYCRARPLGPRSIIPCNIDSESAFLAGLSSKFQLGWSRTLGCKSPGHSYLELPLGELLGVCKPPSLASPGLGLRRFSASRLGQIHVHARVSFSWAK